MINMSTQILDKINCPVCGKLINKYSGFLKHFIYMTQKEKGQEELHFNFLNKPTYEVNPKKLLHQQK